MELRSKFCAKLFIFYAILVVFVTSVAPKIYSRHQILRALVRHPPRRDYDYIDFDSSIEEEIVSSRLRDRYPEFFDREDSKSSSSSGKKAMKRVDSKYGVSKGVSAGGKLLLVLLPFMMIPFILLPVKLFIIFKMFIAGKITLISALLAKVLSKPKYFKHFKKKGKKCKGALLALIPIILIGLLLSSVLSGLISGVVSGAISAAITLINSTVTNLTTTTTTTNSTTAQGKSPVELYVIPEMSLGYSNNRYSYKMDKVIENDNRTRSDTCLLTTEDFRDMSKNEVRILMNLLEKKYSKEPWVTCSVGE